MSKATRTWVLTSVGFGAGWGVSSILRMSGASGWVMAAVGAVTLVVLIWAQWPAPEPRPSLLSTPAQPDDDTLRTWMDDYLERHRLIAKAFGVMAAELFRSSAADSPPRLDRSTFPPPFMRGFDEAMLKTRLKAFDVKANDEMMTRAFGKCGVHWGTPQECVRVVEGFRCQHTCVAPAGHEIEDDFPHGCYCGATLSQSINPATGKVWCWCARPSCEGCPE